jgi:hypothetical protein
MSGGGEQGQLDVVHGQLPRVRGLVPEFHVVGVGQHQSGEKIPGTSYRLNKEIQYIRERKRERERKRDR